jgi:hypothetical protein
MNVKLLVIVLIQLIIFGCVEDAPVKITNPPKGSMFPAGANVQVNVETLNVYSTSVNINDQNIFANEDVFLPPVDGLGFIKASVDNNSLFSVRSYIQGEYVPAHDWNQNTVGSNLGQDILMNEEVSFASLISDMMTNEELAPYVENPLTTIVDMGLFDITVEITLTSVKSPQIDVALDMQGDKLFFTGYLHDVVVNFIADSASFSTDATAFYEYMIVEGEVILSPDNMDMINMSSSAADPVITDDGILPSEAYDPIAGIFDETVLESIEITNKNASRVVFLELLDKIKPQVGLEFEFPITQDILTNSLNIHSNNINLKYDTLIQAATPFVAKPEHNVLKRVHSNDATSQGMSVDFGSGLINQVSFAIWDAGNVNEIIYTQDELRDLGMAVLGEPYNKLKSSKITALLPSILEWDESGPWLVMGGIEIFMVIDGSDDIFAWTASRVPVVLEQNENTIIMKVDENREIFFYDVGFDKMSKFADKSKMIKLLETSIPGVVNDIFSKFPIIEMETVYLSKLNGDEGPVITTILNSISTHSNYWTLDLSFEKIKN